MLDHIDPWGEILASIAWAVRSAYHSVLGATPAQLVFNRDMLFNLKTVVDWKQISARKQKQVDMDNLRENSKRIDHNYQVDDKVYISQDGIYRKLEGPRLGPYKVTKIYTNGTIRVQSCAINKRINIRRLSSHFSSFP